MNSSIKVYNMLKQHYPDLEPFLNYNTDFQLLVAAVLSAQCTDAMVNRVTPLLFEKYGDERLMASAELEEIEKIIRSVNYYKTKSRNIISISRILIDNYESKIPGSINELIKLPGVGRKTANVILGHIFNLPAVTVDTHVIRLANRIGFTSQKDPAKIEQYLKGLWLENIWFDFSTLLIIHGRKVCRAGKPVCSKCVIYKLCKSAGEYEND
ncbi:MAG: endonuclease III [bacterium]|nr:endonuclease III [bacterium]